MKLINSFLVPFLLFTEAGVEAATQVRGGSDKKGRKLSKKSSSRGSRSSKGSDGGFSFEAIATGAQEIPPVVTDTTASLSLSFDEGFTMANFGLDIEDGVNITQVHLHCGLAGINGPVVAFLFNVTATTEGPGGVDVDGQAASGTLTNDDIIPETCGSTWQVSVNNIASLYEAILSRQIYVNVHSEENSSGEVRGQIFP